MWEQAHPPGFLQVRCRFISASCLNRIKDYYYNNLIKDKMMIYNDIYLLDVFRDEKDLDKWFKMGFKEIMEALHIKIDYFESYVTLYDDHVENRNRVLENLKNSTCQIVVSYIFAAYRD